MENDNLILVIARASGTKEISRQNLRLVIGKPLLYYVLKTSLSCSNCSTFVSTDSDEIEAYSKFYGVKTIKRAKRLTKDNTSLEDIAIDALKKLKKEGLSFKKCLIIHPHFPLIKKHTINKFFSQLDKKIHVISGFVNESKSDKHFGYFKNQNNYPKLIKIPKEVIEIKKIISFDCKTLLKKEKFEKQMFGLEISKDEVFSPNNYHDFASLESMMNRKKIIVRVDGDKNIGLGHVYNMLTILNNFRNEDIIILMNSKKNLGYKKFKEHLYNVKFFTNSNEFWTIIDKFKPNLIFNDILSTTSKYINDLKSRRIFIVNFEDLGDGRKYANLVFNPIFENKKQLKNEFYGSKYACVREEFRIFKRKAIRNKIEKIGITFGGIDKNNNTCKILLFINQFQILKNIEIQVILGLGYMHKKKFEKIIEKMKKNGYKINFTEKANMLSKYLVDCDFVIASNGRTVFEVASLKIPIISLSVNKREKQHNFVKRSCVGYNIDLNKKKYELILKRNIDNMMMISIRKKFMKNLQKEDLLKGINRVTEKILTEYEKVKN